MTLLYLYRDSVPDSGWLALGFVIVYVAGSFLPLFGDGEGPFRGLPSRPNQQSWRQLSHIPSSGLGIHLPSLFKRVGARNDYSYGVYIYGWPVMQLLGMWGVQRLGYVVFTVSAIAGSVGLGRP